MKRFIVLAVMLALSGCETTRPKDTVPPAIRTPPADAMQVCPSLDDVDLGGGGLHDLARALQDVSSRYQSCRARHGELVDWVGAD